MQGWIGVDLDGTLAEYHGWVSEEHIGPPVPAMVARVKRWIAKGKDVRIFTARVCPGIARCEGTRSVYRIELVIKAWCLKHIGTELPITHEKDYGMIELWDDRCVQVEPNTGRRVDGKE